MRRMLWMGLGLVCAAMAASPVQASDDSDKVIGGVLSGLLGAPQAPPDQVYSAQERERLASMLQSGQYVTSRQGEPIDMMVYGIPLTRAEHVYTAKPITPSQTSYPTR